MRPRAKVFVFIAVCGVAYFLGLLCGGYVFRLLGHTGRRKLFIAVDGGPFTNAPKSRGDNLFVYYVRAAGDEMIEGLRLGFVSEDGKISTNWECPFDYRVYFNRIRDLDGDGLKEVLVFNPYLKVKVVFLGTTGEFISRPQDESDVSGPFLLRLDPKGKMVFVKSPEEGKTAGSVYLRWDRARGFYQADETEADLRAVPIDE